MMRTKDLLVPATSSKVPLPPLYGWLFGEHWHSHYLLELFMQTLHHIRTHATYNSWDVCLHQLLVIIASSYFDCAQQYCSLQWQYHQHRQLLCSPPVENQSRQLSFLHSLPIPFGE